MVRIRPSLSMTTPVPSRSAPKLVALRAFGSALAWTFTIAPKNFSASMPGCALPAADVSAATAGRATARPAAVSHAMTRHQHRERGGIMTTSGEEAVAQDLSTMARSDRRNHRACKLGLAGLTPGSARYNVLDTPLCPEETPFED